MERIELLIWFSSKSRFESFLETQRQSQRIGGLSDEAIKIIPNGGGNNFSITATPIEIFHLGQNWKEYQTSSVS